MTTYQGSFTDVATDVLPRYFAELQRRMATPMALSDFAVSGTGVRRLLARAGRPADVAGLYVILEGERPIYVGISRRVFQRLREHVRGRTQFDGSLPYRIAAARQPHTQSRGAAMKDPAFRAAFDEAKRYLATLHAAVLEIADPTELYLLEVFTAMAFKCELNTFETH
jgi:predicted GIY-YIG superfamily endonuclease